MGNNTKRRRIAVIVASMHGGEYAYQTLSGIMQEAAKNQLDIYIFNADIVTDETVKHTIGEYNVFSLANFSAFDGIILFANLIQSHAVLHRLIESIKESKVPTISIDAPIEGFHYVGVENYPAMKELVTHLIEKHHYTKINYLSGQDFNTDSKERLQAYCDALTEHGIPVEEKRIIKGAFTNIFGREAAKKMLNSGEELPEAVVCATDWIALGVRAVFVENGIKIPQQVALTGFDNGFDARNAVPRFTSVDRDMVNVGRTTVNEMIRLMDGEEVPVKQLFPAFTVFAESCGCTHNDDDDIRSVRLKYLQYKEQSEKNLQNCGVMTEELNDSKTLRELLLRLRKFILNLKCKAFYLCLDKDFVEDLQHAGRDEWHGNFHNNLRTLGIPEKTQVVLAYEDGEFVQYDEFKTEQMLPDIEDMQDNAHVFIFSPLHFRDNFMGYVVLDRCRFSLENPIFNTWMLNLCISLENLRKQAYMKNMLRQMDRMYVVEPLTGLYNRFGFARYTGENFKRCAAEGRSLMILFADLDGLKIINDQYGHEKGDIAIKAVADALRQACHGNEVCARFGGDEYVVYAEGYSKEDAKAFCEEFEKNLEEKNAKSNLEFKIDASFGYIMVIPKEGEVIDKYIDMADNIMYVNKKRKKFEKNS